MSIPRDRWMRAAWKAILGLLVPPVGFWAAGQPASAIVSVLAAFMAAGMFALGDVGLALSSWFFVCLWAALMSGTEIEEIRYLEAV